jgi:dTDP-4-dehydrorhamnose reductase
VHHSTRRKVLITGGAGFLGRALTRAVPASVALELTIRRESSGSGTPSHALDLADRPAVERLWEGLRPELVIHTAYSMDAPERDIWEATRNVADATCAVGADLLYLSTDMLLDGEHAPYAEDAAPAPVLEYGRWKARAEDYVRSSMPDAAVVRTSLLTSFAPLDPRSEWVAAGLRGGSSRSLYADEIRCPISVHDLAAQLWEIADLPGVDRSGVWHLAGPEAISRYSLGLLIAAFLELPADRLVAAPSSTAAGKRPRDLRLLSTRADAQLRTRARPISLVAMQEKNTTRGDLT